MAGTQRLVNIAAELVGLDVVFLNQDALLLLLCVELRARLTGLPLNDDIVFSLQAARAERNLLATAKIR